MARQSHSGEIDVLESEQHIRSKKDENRNRKASSDSDIDDEWFEHIDDYDDIPMYISED